MADYQNKIDIALNFLVLSLIDIAPIMAVCLMLPLPFFLLSFFEKKSKFAMLYSMQFFSTMGVVIAYITQLSRGSIISDLLPSLIVVITFFFQLFGRLNIGHAEPINTRTTFLSGTMTMISFLISSRYFVHILGGGS